MVIKLIQRIIPLGLEVLFEKEYLIIKWDGEEFLVVSHFLMTDRNIKKELLSEIMDRINEEEDDYLKGKLIQLEEAIKNN